LGAPATKKFGIREIRAECIYSLSILNDAEYLYIVICSSELLGK
jgi:hypothetical protein